MNTKRVLTLTADGQLLGDISWNHPGRIAVVTVYHNVSVLLRHALIGVEIHFLVSLVLYMIYYPQEMKYEFVDSVSDAPGTIGKTPKKRDEWQISIVLAWIVAAHLYVWRFSRARCGLLPLASSYPSLRSIF